MDIVLAPTNIVIIVQEKRDKRDKMKLRHDRQLDLPNAPYI